MSVDPFEKFKKKKSEQDQLDRKNLPEENVGKVSDYFSIPEEVKEARIVPENPAPSSGGGSSSTSAVKRLEALIQLLVRKGVITEEELKAMLTLLG